MTMLLQSLEELQDWEGYRAFLKAQLKLLTDGDPVWVSKEKVDFTVKGKPYVAYAVIVGQKGAQSALKLRKEGVLFREGVCKLEDKTLFLEGIPDKAVKGAAKTFKKLLLGYKIHADEEEGEGEEGEDTPLVGARQAGEDEAAPQPSAPLALDKTPQLWSGTQRLVRTRLEQLKAAVRKAFSGEDRTVLAETERSLEKLDRLLQRLDDELTELLEEAARSEGPVRTAALQSAKTLLATHILYVKNEPLIAHIDANPFGIATDIQGTLTKSMKHLVGALGAG